MITKTRKNKKLTNFNYNIKFDSIDLIGFFIAQILLFLTEFTIGYLFCKIIKLNNNIEFSLCFALFWNWIFTISFIYKHCKFYKTKE